MADLCNIDWGFAGFDAVRGAATALLGRSDWLSALNRQSAGMALANHRGLPVRFVDQSVLPEGSAYEAFISATGKVPTRDNLHDLFNALVWLSFPAIKRRLNAIQAEQIERTGIGKSRGPARDAATIFDENAALLVVNDTLQGCSLAEALRNHEWHSAFIEQRASFGPHAEVWLFGHALMEKLVTPYKGITAHTWVVTAPEDFFQLPSRERRQWLDTTVADDLTSLDMKGLSTKCFTPLPVLGVPGWWQPQDRNFYADAAVFRPKRRG